MIDARGRDARGNGTAAAKVTAVLTDDSSGAGTSTLVKVTTDLDITGKPAQFGRGVMVDVGNKLIGQFADSLAAEITSGSSTAFEAAGGSVGCRGTRGCRCGQRRRDGRRRDGLPRPRPRRRPHVDAAPSPPLAQRPGRPVPASIPTRSPPRADGPGAFAAPGADAASVAPGMTDDGGPAEQPAADATVETNAVVTNDVATNAEVAGADAASTSPANGRQVKPSRPVREVEPINLLESAGPAIAKRLAPVAGGVVLAVLFVLIGRHRARR